MNFNKNIKADALLVLKNNWLKSIFITCTWMLISFVSFLLELFIYRLTDIDDSSSINIINSILFNSNYRLTLAPPLITLTLISLILGVVYHCIASILKNGDTLWNFSVISNLDNDFLNIFDYFSSLKKIMVSWYISLQLFIRKIIWSIIIFIPPMLVGSWSILATIYQNRLSHKVLIPFGYILTSCLMIASTTICIIFFQRYALTRYLYVSKECSTVRQAIKSSIKIMNGKKSEYLSLIVSFIFWFISCIFIIPIFFVFPYFKISLTLYSRYVIEGYNHDKMSHSS